MTGFYFAVDGSVKDYIIVKLKTINAEVGKCKQLPLGPSDKC